MAKIHQETITIKFSKLMRDNDTVDSMILEDIKDTLASVAQELVGNNVVVEVESVQ
jgi:hypothetical protein